MRDNGGHLVALNWSMRNIYGVEPGEVYWAASDLGWAVGHSYIVYGPLFHGNTTILYEGKPVGTPDPGAFWRVISQHKVRAFFTAPTAFRAIKRDDPTGEHVRRYDLSRLSHSLPRRRAVRPRDAPLGGGAARRTGDRPLVADRDGLAGGLQLRRARSPPGQAGIVRAARAGLRREGAERRGDGAATGRDGERRDPAAAAARLPADALEQRGGLPRDLPERLSRLLHDGGRGVQGRRRLPLDHEPHRRHDQRRRPPAVDRRDGGSAGRAPGRRRVRGHRCRGRRSRARSRSAWSC